MKLVSSILILRGFLTTIIIRSCHTLLRQRVNFEDWDDPVSSLNHTAGFIKFADLQIESGGSDGNGGAPGSGGGNGDGDGDGGGPGPIIPPPIIIPPDTEIIVDIIQDGISLNCYTQWDLVTENEYFIGSRKTSNQIYFRTKEIADFFESIGNRVLIIDDFSGEFNSDPRLDKFSEVEKFDITRRFSKILTYVADKADIYDRQLSILLCSCRMEPMHILLTMVGLRLRENLEVLILELLIKKAL